MAIKVGHSAHVRRHYFIRRGPFIEYTHQAHNVETTLIQRQDDESTLNQRCLNVVCPQDRELSIISNVTYKFLRTLEPFSVRLPTFFILLKLRSLKNKMKSFKNSQRRKNNKTSVWCNFDLAFELNKNHVVQKQTMEWS